MDPYEPVRYLLSILDLRPDGDDRFIGTNGEGGTRLFGGLVAAQALRAAQLTVPSGDPVNSLHSYFLRPGRYGTPVTFTVDRIRDGSSFATRRVVAIQEGEAIFNLEASFHRHEAGDEYQVSSLVDVAAPPTTAPPVRFEGPRGGAHRRPFELRDPDLPAEAAPARAVWIRAAHQLPDDPAVHACVLTFLSDMGPVMAVRRRLARPGLGMGGFGMGGFGMGMTASLDHCLWFHRAARADEWLLYQLDAVAAAGARGVARGEVWTQDGHLAVSVMQEALVRPPRRRPESPPRSGTS
jgi:acyl-CoA thioesterase-2